MDSQIKLVRYPSSVAVIGGGRWARVLTDVLCSLVSPSVKISVHSPSNAKAMSEWVSERGLGERIRVSADFSGFSSGISNAVIVANAARDHEKSVEWALSNGFPVLVEKPLTLNLAATQRLADLARNQNTYFAAAHVFLFASYVETFSKLVAAENNIQHIRVLWMDPQLESRYGEAKSYDPGLTIYADWLPHVISILGSLTASQTLICKKLEFLKGGAHLKIDLQLGDVLCEIELVRNGDCRQRIFEVTSQQKNISLNFASEPGTIVSDSKVLCGDVDWSVNPKPVSRMIGAFLLGAAGGMRDDRLDISIGLRASRAIDQVSVLYYPALRTWLSKKLMVIQDDIDSDLRYALTELIHEEDPYSSVPIGQRIDYVCRHIKEHAASSLNAELFANPVEVICSILKRGRITLYC